MENATLNHSQTHVKCEEHEIIGSRTWRILCTIILFIIVILTVYGNIMLIVKVVKRKQFHRKIYVFVVSLAVADGCVGLLVMTPSIVHGLLGVALVRETMADRALFMLDCLFTTSSVLHFTCMNIDRFVAVSKPFKYFRIMSRKVVVVLICLCWLVSFSLSLTIIFVTEENKCEKLFIVKGLAAVLGSLIAFYLPLSLNIFASVNIYRKVSNRKKEMFNHIGENYSGDSQRGRKLETRVTKTLIVLQSAFIAFTTPFFVLMVLENAFGFQNSKRTWFFISWLGYCNSTINPYLFYFMNKRLKNMYESGHSNLTVDTNKLRCSN